MTRLPLLAMLLLLADPSVPLAQDRSFPTLRFVEAIRIADRRAGMDEPSGVAVSQDARHLWTVSDDARAVYLLGLDGDIRRRESFPITERGLEGIAVHPSGDLLAVKEETSEILVIGSDERRIVDRVALDRMLGYHLVAPEFAGGSRNRGLEGITIDPATGRVYVIKQSRPRLLIEISPDLRAITAVRELTAGAGFTDNNRRDRKIDVSGIAYDRWRDRFWIVSDTAQRVYLYDWARHQAVSAPLVWNDRGWRRTIEHAEGIAVDPAGDRLYIVTDDKGSSRLFVFRIE
ncbi:MAG TPA: SdiA-regulated domain-containing protein [Thermohalobaculum sp.]|nr:SdiA-regulated domain-containing protein [Thermohalobaculum sp.]